MWKVPQFAATPICAGAADEVLMAPRSKSERAIMEKVQRLANILKWLWQKLISFDGQLNKL